MRLGVPFESAGKRWIGRGDSIGEAAAKPLISGGGTTGHGGVAIRHGEFRERARAIAGTSVAPAATIRTTASTIRVILNANEPVTLARSASTTAASARKSGTRAAPEAAINGLVICQLYIDKR